jgi:hypothetical protein
MNPLAARATPNGWLSVTGSALDDAPESTLQNAAVKKGASIGSVTEPGGNRRSLQGTNGRSREQTVVLGNEQSSA